MTLVTGRLDQATMVRAAPPTALLAAARPVIVSGRLWRATVVVGDLLGVVGIVLCIPFVMLILAIGIPIVLCVRLIVWIGRLLRGVSPPS
jgi:hypothetical protein